MAKLLPDRRLKNAQPHSPVETIRKIRSDVQSLHMDLSSCADQNVGVDQAAPDVL